MYFYERNGCFYAIEKSQWLTVTIIIFDVIRGTFENARDSVNVRIWHGISHWGNISSNLKWSTQ